jgi:hypothetical protein
MLDILSLKDKNADKMKEAEKKFQMEKEKV